MLVERSEPVASWESQSYTVLSRLTVFEGDRRFDCSAIEIYTVLRYEFESNMINYNREFVTGILFDN